VVVAGKGMREFLSKLGVGGHGKPRWSPAGAASGGGGEKPTRQPE
jgi:hypothetical protein